MDVAHLTSEFLFLEVPQRDVSDGRTRDENVIFVCPKGQPGDGAPILRKLDDSLVELDVVNVNVARS